MATLLELDILIEDLPIVVLPFGRFGVLQIPKVSYGYQSLPKYLHQNLVMGFVDKNLALRCRARAGFSRRSRENPVAMCGHGLGVASRVKQKSFKIS